MEESSSLQRTRDLGSGTAGVTRASGAIRMVHWLKQGSPGIPMAFHVGGEVSKDPRISISMAEVAIVSGPFPIMALAGSVLLARPCARGLVPQDEY